MRYRNITNRFESCYSQLNMKKQNVKKCFLGKYFINSTFLFSLVAVAIILCLFTGSANAQPGSLAGYVVQPGRIDVVVKPRDSYETELRIHNFDPNNPIVIQFKIIELTQNENGDWQPFDTDPCSPFDFDPTLDLSKISSCSSWINMEEGTVTIPSDDDVVIPVRINVPFNARTGFYGATIMASTRAAASETEKVPMVIRTGIPVVANVQIVPNMPSRIEIEDIGMEFVESQRATLGKVLLTMKTKNSGNTFSRLRPIIRLRGFINDHWQLITTHQFEEIGIIPGKELVLKSDIGRSLPSAKYQLDALLYVDGQLRGRNSRMGKEIDFKGDPLKNEVNPDVPLDLDPREVIIEMVPGFRRNFNIKVHAAIAERIDVIPILDVPKSFKGMVDGTVKLENALSCANWISFRQEKLTLEGYRTRNLTMVVEMPKDAVKYPNYYASLGLKVVYPDGDVAGTTWLNVCVSNERVSAEPDVKCTAINLREINATNSIYSLISTFKNIGNSHIVPTRVRAAVVKADGFGYTSAFLSTDKPGMLMPYETRYFTGDLNFSSLDPDEYNLEVLMDYSNGKKIQRQVRVRVRDIRGRRLPEILNGEVQTIIPVKWL